MVQGFRGKGIRGLRFIQGFARSGPTETATYVALGLGVSRDLRPYSQLPLPASPSE